MTAKEALERIRRDYYELNYPQSGMHLEGLKRWVHSWCKSNGIYGRVVINELYRYVYALSDIEFCKKYVFEAWAESEDNVE